ncbi:MAG: FAD:protein FMN transferase [Planctomycetaceae bacterium]
MSNNNRLSAPTIRLSSQAMACEFAVILNQNDHAAGDAGSLALERVDTLSKCMTVYEPNSELSLLNTHRSAASVSDDLMRVLSRSMSLFHSTEGRFDPTAGPLIELWRTCRADQRVPTDLEIETTLRRVDANHIALDGSAARLGADVEVNLGAIGKGFALDEASSTMLDNGSDCWLLHGGRSSIIARGSHNDQGGWPVGIGNPIFTNRRLGIVILENEALGTSGSNIQYFRHRGKRYGHILDPKTGWPANQVASVTILAPTATEADALSTAFFVGGVEFARIYCDNHPEISAILIPFPESGTTIRPVLVNMPADRVVWNKDQVDLS